MKALYDRNSDFKSYVDKYATKAKITAEEALQSAVAREYASYVLEKERVHEDSEICCNSTCDDASNVCHDNR